MDPEDRRRRLIYRSLYTGMKETDIRGDRWKDSKKDLLNNGDLFSLTQPKMILVTKANLRSTVHRNVHLDTIGIKIFNDKRVDELILLDISASKSRREPKIACSDCSVYSSPML